MSMRMTAAVLALALAIGSSAQTATKTIVASDKRTQITIPERWSTLELNEAAEIQVGNAEDEAYLIVLNEAKDDLDGWNLERHSRVTLGRLLSGISSPTVSGPKSITVGGNPAVQYEIRGASDDQKIVYIHTTVDGRKNFAQILAWTLPSRAETVQPQLLSVISTFREAE